MPNIEYLRTMRIIIRKDSAVQLVGVEIS